MPKETVSTSSWTEVHTTTVDTVFQNQSSKNPMYITTEYEASLPFNEGFYLPPSSAVIISPGKTVYAVTFMSESQVFYMEV